MLRARDAGREAIWQRRQADPVNDAGEPTVWGLEEHARPSNVEALVAMADLALTRPDRDRTSAERYQVVVHVDAPALAQDADGRCELESGRMSLAVARTGAAAPYLTVRPGSIVELQEHNGVPLSPGVKRRTYLTRFARALAARDRGCRFPRATTPALSTATTSSTGARAANEPRQPRLALSAPSPACPRARLLGPVRRRRRAAFTNQYGIAIPNVPARRLRIAMHCATSTDACACSSTARPARPGTAIEWSSGSECSRSQPQLGSRRLAAAPLRPARRSARRRAMCGRRSRARV